MSRYFLSAISSPEDIVLDTSTQPYEIKLFQIVHEIVEAGNITVSLAPRAILGTANAIVASRYLS